MTGDVDGGDDRGTNDSAIRQLDPQTVERIAAGEVVERPASVVKELVENSLDADASRVSVAVEAGGTEGVRITDDGLGMTRDEVETAVEKHTTSKISDIEDLEAGVATLGFRGEALHAVGAVSRVTITTRPRGGDTGTELVLEGGEVTSVGPAGCPEGTTIAVEDLFYNVPARRKYLKQASTEFAHVNTVVTSYALANPDVAVTLEHGGRETFATTGQGDLQETVMSVYGREVARSMIAVDDSDLPDGPLDGVSGLVSHPETNRAGREYLSTYVNGRYVRANAVREAIVDAYDTQLAPDRYPFAVLFLDVDPGTVDVNVHPRKYEIRFADEEGVRDQVTTAVEGALLREGLVRSGAPRGRSAPDQAEITPERSEEGGEKDGGQSGQSQDQETADSQDQPGGTGSRRLSIDSSDVKSGENAGTSRREGSSSSSDEAESRAAGASVDSTTESPRPSSDDTTETDTDSPNRSSDPVRPSDPDRKFSGGREQRRLGGEEPTESFDTLPSMRVLGQLHETYVVAETDDGLVLVDQHAADERINYERLKAAFQGETTTQALAEPVELELTAREAELFADRGEALARLGFQANWAGSEVQGTSENASGDGTEPRADRTVEVTTVPGVVADGAGPELVRDALSAFVSGDGSAADTVEAAADELLGDLACYPSITGNTSLTEGSIRDLLAALDDCDNPYACPHGRPVVIELDRGELEDRFERDYPGHSGRRE